MRHSYNCPDAAGFEVAHFWRAVWPKATFHRSLGHRPRNSERYKPHWPKAKITVIPERREYGLRPKVPFFRLPGALPQATVMNGLRPNVCNFKAAGKGVWAIDVQGAKRLAAFGCGANFRMPLSGDEFGTVPEQPGNAACVSLFTERQTLLDDDSQSNLSCCETSRRSHGLPEESTPSHRSSRAT